MPNKLKIDENLLKLAADKLDEAGTHHGWWKTKHNSWREFDKIGQEEFLDIVWSIIKTYRRFDVSADQINAHDISDYQVQRKNDFILIGFAIEGAVLDVNSTMPQIEACLQLLGQTRLEPADKQLGVFGGFQVRLNCYPNGETSIFIDGPQFDETRSQSSAIWVNKQSLRTVLESVRTQALENNG